MIEAKDKEQAVLFLYKLYNLHPVNEEVFYENSNVETKHTMKSKKGLKAVKEAKLIAKAELEAKSELDSVSQDAKPHPKKKSVKHKKITVEDIRDNDTEQVSTVKKRNKAKPHIESKIEADTTEALQVSLNEPEAGTGLRRSKRKSSTKTLN